MRSSICFCLVLATMVLTSAGCERNRAASVSGRAATADGPMVAQQQPQPQPSTTTGTDCDQPISIDTTEVNKNYRPFNIHICGDDAWHFYDSVLASAHETSFDLASNPQGWDGAFTKTNGALQCVKYYVDPVKDPQNKNKTQVFCDLDLTTFYGKSPSSK